MDRGEIVLEREKGVHGVTEAKRGYQGFGSFMTDASVNQLIDDACSSSYSPPTHPFDSSPVEAVLSGLDSTTPFGEEARRLFMVDFDQWTFVNHGAFGAVCIPAFIEASLWRQHCESQPLTFLDRQLFPHMVRMHRELGDFVGSSPQDVCFVPNATTGLNIVLQSCLGPNDIAYMLDIGYGSVKKMLARSPGSLPSDSPSHRHVVQPVPFPLTSPAELVKLVEETLPQNAKLAIFDAITSNTAIVLPLKELVEICHKRGVLVLVDGAHALGHFPSLNVPEFDADFYTGNAHKWLCGPRGSGFLWVKRERQGLISPLVMSHGSGSGFVSDFIWTGCDDYSPFLGIRSAIKMWESLGLERCHCYCIDLIKTATTLLTDGWDTELLVPLNMCARMALVSLPWERSRSRQASDADAKLVQDTLYQEKIECPVKLIQGSLYVRISAQIYNTLEDYVKLRDAVIKMMQSDVFLSKAGEIQFCTRRGGGCG